MVRWPPRTAMESQCWNEPVCAVSPVSLACRDEPWRGGSSRGQRACHLWKKRWPRPRWMMSWNGMKCGRLCSRKTTNAGVGWPCVAAPGRLWPTSSAITVKRVGRRIPRPYTRCHSFSDFWDAYQRVFATDRHQSVGKDSGQTKHIERWFNTLRQRLARFVRKTLSFSKHELVFRRFVHHYNLACIS